MADDEIQRGIEFLVQQQAKYEARQAKDESRIAELQEYFKMLVELARGSDERLDLHASRLRATRCGAPSLKSPLRCLPSWHTSTNHRLDNVDPTSGRELFLPCSSP